MWDIDICVQKGSGILSFIVLLELVKNCEFLFYVYECVHSFKVAFPYFVQSKIECSIFRPLDSWYYGMLKAKKVMVFGLNCQLFLGGALIIKEEIRLSLHNNNKYWGNGPGYNWAP